MKIQDTLFTITDWDKIKPIEYKGEIGTSFWRTIESRNIRVRIVEYSAGFKSNHFCSKGHILLVLEGTLYLEIKNGRIVTLDEGMSFLVGDSEKNFHLAFSKTGAKVFIVD